MKPKYDFIVIGMSAITFLLIFVFSQISPQFATILNDTINWLCDSFGWLLNLGTLFCTFFSLYFAFSKFGKIKLGGADAKPEFKTFTWWAMSLCAGMGMGIVFFPPAEIIEYTYRPASGLGLASGEYETMVWAMEQTMMHWAITLYGIYVAAGIVAAYVFHNLDQPFSITSMLYPAFGKKVYKYRSIIDGLVTFAIVGGVAGSFGYGILQIANGLQQVFGIPSNTASWIMITIVITAVYTLSSISGLKKGIQWLGDNNAKLFIAMLLFVVIFGPTVFSINFGVEATGSMFANFFKNISFTEAITPGGEKWAVWWNYLWYMDYFIFAPTTAFFLARLAKGRTLKEFVLVNMVAPGLFGMAWCWFFGGLAGHVQITGAIDLNNVILTQGTEGVMLTLFDSLPLPMITKAVMMLTVMISFVTLANAVTSTVSKMSLKDADDSIEAPKMIQIFWGVLMGGIAILFLLQGGLDGAKAIKLLVGFPIVVIVLLSVGGFLRFFINKNYKEAKEIEGIEPVKFDV
ncbi:hypothetical protein AN644_01400 [Candidatus Epulonipiscium fishelsonii]|nr:hypothetical protein AN644_01400 [Epulopiscium sp. SCG-C06WGA-EpuloA1]